ncbi:MAG: hypothetical protein ACREV5_06560 [Steroidobacter sp.]
MCSASILLLTQLTLAACAVQPRIARTPDGKPDLTGIWQAIGSAHWNLEPHAAQAGPIAEMGALGAIPGGLGVVESGRIPYTPEAVMRRAENKAAWLERDPLVKCCMPGVPRATYLPHPFQITQEPQNILITYEFAGATRIVYMDRPDLEAQVDSWMGHNLGSWEDDTLVIDVTAQTPDAWLDSAGNFHGPALRVQERYTPVDANTLLYEAILTDSDVFTQPWKISMPLYRRMDENMQLLDFKCVEFVEDLLYGKYRKRPAE